MTDESSLTDLVWANRAEPLPRLIYADWLDDIGDPPAAQKAAFLRLWCRLRDTPLSDLDGYPELTTQLEALKPGLPDAWLRVVDGNRFRIANEDAARTRADAFLGRILHEGDYEVGYPRVGDAGWVVSFSVKPTIDVDDEAYREKEQKWGGRRRPKRPPVVPRRVQLPAYPTATPLFVDATTGRVGWYRPRLPRRRDTRQNPLDAGLPTG